MSIMMPIGSIHKIALIQWATWCWNSLEELNKLKLSVSFQYFHFHCLQSPDSTQPFTSKKGTLMYLSFFIFCFCCLLLSIGTIPQLTTALRPSKWAPICNFEAPKLRSFEAFVIVIEIFSFGFENSTLLTCII